MGVVTRSMEFERIMRLPRRVLDLEKIEDATPVFAKPGSTSGSTMKLWPIQSAMLIEASLANGLFAAVGVGWGKSLTSLCLPTAMGSDKTVLLVPPQLKRQLIEKMIPEYLQHFDLPIDKITVVAYSELSSADKADVLDRIDPDLIIADEAHALRHRSSARTKRLLRFFRAHPECRFAGLSGTMTTRSLLDYAHLIELALRKNSPIPLGWRELQDWAGAIDVKPERPTSPGVLREFCESEESVRDGFRRRLIETQGAVATDEATAIGTSLVIRRLDLDIPLPVKEAIRRVKKHWEIDGEELEDALALSRILRQLAAGFYYRFVWVNGKDHQWLEARAAWHREVREYLSHRARPGMDSPLLLARAAEWGDWESATWEGWKAVKDRPTPPTEAVWVDQFLIWVVGKWIMENASTECAIVWVEHRAVGEALKDALDIPYYDTGDAAFATEPVIVCSVKSQSVGKNLQRFSRNLVTTCPANGTTWEQLIGRTHRPGQEADEVMVDWLGHTPEMIAAFDSALADSTYMQETMGARQKLLYATRI
jgi:hypothetical protein